MSALESALSLLPSTLVSPDAAKKLRAVPRVFPWLPTDNAWLEFRLGPDGRVDLGQILVSPEQFRQVVAEGGREGWETAARLAARSINLPRLRAQVPSWIWLEFDLDTDGLTAPGVSGYARQTGGTPRDPNDALVAAELLTITHEDARSLTPIVDTVLGSGLTVMGITTFPSRNDPSVRLYCGTTTIEDSLISTLERAGWDGSRPIVSSWIDHAADLGAHLDVDLNITAAGLAPALGLNISLAHLPEADRASLWDRNLSFLEAPACACPPRLPPCGPWPMRRNAPTDRELPIATPSRTPKCGSGAMA